MSWVSYTDLSKDTAEQKALNKHFYIKLGKAVAQCKRHKIFRCQDCTDRALKPFTENS